MKVTIIFGSPRKNGNTASLVEVFIDQLKKNKVEIDFFDVYKKDIGGCKACLWCQKDKTKIDCIIKDDMISILESMEKSDIIIYAAPIYIWSAPAPVKAVIDRTVYASCKYYGDDPHGPALLKGKRLALITTCGYPIDKASDLYESQMKRYCKHLNLSYSGIFVERQRNLKEIFMNDEKERKVREFANNLVK